MICEHSRRIYKMPIMNCNSTVLQMTYEDFTLRGVGQADKPIKILEYYKPHIICHKQLSRKVFGRKQHY